METYPNSYKPGRSFKCSHLASRPHLAIVGVLLTLQEPLDLGVRSQLELGPPAPRPDLQTPVCALARRSV